MSGTNTVSPLRQRMIEDMAARKLDPHTQRSHISSCKRFTTSCRGAGTWKRSASSSRRTASPRVSSWGSAAA